MTKLPSLTDISTVVRPFLRLLPPDDPLDPERNLGDLGLDSMASIDLLLELENHFEISIADDQLTENSFSNITEIHKVVVTSLTD